MNTSKVLLISSNLIFPRHLYNSIGIEAFEYYDHNISKILKLLRKITVKNSFFRRFIWLQPWYSRIHLYEKVILIAINGIDDIFIDIRKKKIENKIIIFFWDPVFRVSECLNNSFDKWSFDNLDCAKFNLRFNTTFFFRDLVIQFTSSTNLIKYEIYFVGRDKGRKHYLDFLKSSFENIGLRVYMRVGEDNFHKSDESSAYEKNLIDLQLTMSILDIAQDGQSGLSLRVMESIFFKKKLITTNRYIVDAPFYNTNNIFVLTHDNLIQLPEFLNKPYEDTDWEKFVGYYDAVAWLNRFND